MLKPAGNGGFLYELMAVNNSTMYQTAVSK